jgi:hypothetical protein
MIRNRHGEILPGSSLSQSTRRGTGQLEGILKFTVGEESSVTGDGGAVELHLMSSEILGFGGERSFGEKIRIRLVSKAWREMKRLPKGRNGKLSRGEGCKRTLPHDLFSGRGNSFVAYRQEFIDEGIVLPTIP